MQPPDTAGACEQQLASSAHVTSPLTPSTSQKRATELTLGLLNKHLTSFDPCPLCGNRVQGLEVFSGGTTASHHGGRNEVTGHAAGLGINSCLDSNRHQEALHAFVGTRDGGMTQVDEIPPQSPGNHGTLSLTDFACGNNAFNGPHPMAVCYEYNIKSVASLLPGKTSR